MRGEREEGRAERYRGERGEGRGTIEIGSIYYIQVVEVQHKQN